MEARVIGLSVCKASGVGVVGVNAGSDLSARMAISDVTALAVTAVPDAVVSGVAVAGVAAVAAALVVAAGSATAVDEAASFSSNSAAIEAASDANVFRVTASSARAVLAVIDAAISAA